jgi:hypothetical protein
VLIVIAIISALGLGWLGCQANWIRQRHAFLAEMKPKMCEVSPSEVLMSSDSYRPRGLPAIAAWPMRLLGEERHRSVSVPFPQSSPEVARAVRLFPEAQVFFRFDPPGDSRTP